MIEKLRKCLRCHNSQALGEFVFGYHFEPCTDHLWCRTCQYPTH